MQIQQTALGCGRSPANGPIPRDARIWLNMWGLFFNITNCAQQAYRNIRTDTDYYGKVRPIGGDIIR